MQQPNFIYLNQADLETVLEKVVLKALNNHKPNTDNGKPKVELITRKENRQTTRRIIADITRMDKKRLPSSL